MITAEGELPIWIPESLVRRFARETDWRPGIELFFLAPEAPSGRSTISGRPLPPSAALCVTYFLRHYWAGMGCPVLG